MQVSAMFSCGHVSNVRRRDHFRHEGGLVDVGEGYGEGEEGR
jgi:3-dehydroquinate dehydratase